MKTKVLLLSLLLLIGAALHAEKLDGRINPADTARISILINKGHAVMHISPDSAMYFADRSIELSAINSGFKMAEAKRLKMIAHYYRGELTQCVKLLKEIMPILPKSNLKKYGAACSNLALMYTELFRTDSAEIYYDSATYYYERMKTPYIQGMADVLANKSILEMNRGNPEIALKYNFQSLELFDPEENPKYYAMGYNNIGSIYLRMNNFEDALFYLKKSLKIKIAEEMYHSISNTYELIGDAYIQMDEYAKAETNFKEALYYDRKIGNRPGEASTLMSMANLYFVQELNDMALKTALESDRIKKKFSNVNDQATIQHLLGRIYRAMGQHEKSRQALDNAETVFLKLGSLTSLVELLKERSALEEDMGNTALALSYERRANQANQALLNEEKVGMMVKMEAKFQNELKAEKIKNLSVEAKLHQTKIKQQRLLLTLIGAGVIILIVVILLMYRASEHRKRIHKMQEAQMKKEQALASLKSMVTGEEKERTRIAKDLHDGLSGLLAATKMKFEVVKEDSAQLREHVNYNEALHSLDEASNEVRRIAHNLVPQLLMRYGLIEALDTYVKNIDGISGLRVKYTHYGMTERLNPQTELTLYRIVQELLNNILKHSNATEVLLEINRKNDLLLLTVEDNGLGFDIGNTDSEGMGLDNLSARVDF